MSNLATAKTCIFSETRSDCKGVGLFHNDNKALIFSPSLGPCLEFGSEKFRSFSLSSSVVLPLDSPSAWCLCWPPLQQLPCPSPNPASGPGVPIGSVAASRCAANQQGGHGTCGLAATQNYNCRRCDVCPAKNRELCHYLPVDVCRKRKLSAISFSLGVN